MAAAATLRPTTDSGAEALAAQTALLVADGSCPKIRELLAEALVPVLWLEAGQPPLETVTAALAERRRQGQPVDTLHWVSHGSPGVLQVAEQRIDQGALLAHQELIAEWGIRELALWSCKAGEQKDFISLWEELTGATIWSSRQPLGRLSTGDTNWLLNTSTNKTQPTLPIPTATKTRFEHQLSTGSSAEILTFGSLTQPTPTLSTADANTQTSNFTNATWDSSKGIEIQVSQSGTATIGFASYVPEFYIGPGAVYLYAVEVQDQDGSTIISESFDNWTVDTAFAFNDASDEGTGSYSADLIWEVWSNNNPDLDDYTLTGGSPNFIPNSILNDFGAAFSVKTSGGDSGIVYPMDGAGPFSTLIGTQITIPEGTTSIYINPTLGYQVTNLTGVEERNFWVGFKYGDVEAKNLFSFSSSEPDPQPTQSSQSAGSDSPAPVVPEDNTPTDPAPAGTNIQPTDDDNDGLREVVTASDGTTIDGNRDGIADALQGEVAGLRLINDGAAGSDYGAVQVSAGTQLAAVTLISPDAETGALTMTARDGSSVVVAPPSGITNSFAGAVAFNVQGVTPGGATSTTINLPTGLVVDSSNGAYMRLNYLTNQLEEYVDAQGNPLYSFQDTDSDGTPDAVVLQLVDGDPQWDGDGEANGTIVDPGFLASGQRNFTGTNRRDTLIGNVLGNSMNGLAGRDWLQGDEGRDVLKGGRDKDRIWGGLKADLITGGKDADRILYYSAEESTADQADTVKFGKKDRFQFRSFDGDSITEGQQSLRYIGKKAFTGTAGELRFTGSGLQADTTGDGQADFVVNFTKATPWFSEANILI